MQAQSKLSGITESIYAGFWTRVWAQILDALFVLPIVFLTLYLNGLGKNMYFYTLLPTLLFMLWYNVYLPQKNGGTPGKTMAGITIIRLDGNYISWKEAALLYVVVFSLSILNIIMISCNVLKANESVFMGLGWLKKSQYLMSLSPIFFKLTSWLTNLWFVGEYLVLLINKRKRSISDFIAGTVVVKTDYLNDIEMALNTNSSES
ncbi:RDD family protein [Flavobacterium sp.]|uniref:RDD family protein n=1 Tax=Flavobacterium sp. TaxID=239 RepID=UPI002625C547|nr:RDD family protein [Flavobacterium sp.]